MTFLRFSSPAAAMSLGTLRMRLLELGAVALCALSASGCGDEAPSTWDWQLPANYPVPNVPEDNPMSSEKVELGRHLFYDTLLSADESYSCSTCHLQELAFSDGLAQAVGHLGDLHPRGSMSLTNVAYNSSFNWANQTIGDLETQAIGPIFGETPPELGMAGREDELLQRLEDSDLYRQLFAEAFDDAEPISLDNTLKALAAFQRTLLSFDSPYDRWVQGDMNALDESELRGLQLFFSERLECFHCHGGANLSDSSAHADLAFSQRPFHNTGLYNIGEDNAYPPGSEGLFETTFAAEDMGRFKAPTLRNIALTAPYMHDGSLETLDAVIDHYSAGGTNRTEGPYAGDGRTHPNKSEFVRGFILTERERSDLLAFLHALTDQSFVENPDFSSPFVD